MRISTLRNKPYYHWVIFAAVAVGTFMATLDSSIVNVALPTISETFKVELPVLQWVVTAYLLTISSLLPTLGRLADMYGRSWIFNYGLLSFAFGSLCCGLSSTVSTLVLSRVIQAIGAAMMMANSMGIITAVFPQKMRGRALGTMGAVVAAGSITGPSFGGIIISNWGWPAIFFVNIPIGIIGFFAGLVILPQDKHLGQESFDLLGAVLFAAGMISLLLGLSLAEEYGWGSGLILMLLFGALMLLALFIGHEIKCPYPMIDLTLFRNHIFAAGNAAGLISFIVIFSVNILMPFYLQTILYLEPRQVGMMLTPFPLVMAFFSPFSGWLSDKVGPMIPTILGLGIGALNVISMAFLTAESSMVSVAVRLGIMGMAMSIFQAPNNSAVLGSVPRHKLGVAGGIVATVRNLGMVLGIAFSVTVFSSRQGAYLASGAGKVPAFMHGFRVAMVMAAGFCILGAIMSIIRGKGPDETGNAIEES
ncbi:MAG: MFS transporter [Bacillota bacterium]|jgi:EmrB/QacA subfamily drug resistance transporter